MTLAHFALANLALANLALANLAIENLAIAHLALANVTLDLFVLGNFVSGCWVWGTCNGRLGEPGKKGTGGTEGDGRLEPAHKKNSKNPSKQSLVREQSFFQHFQGADFFQGNLQLAEPGRWEG